jgi:predicted permease
MTLWPRWFSRQQWEHEMTEELRGHVEQQTAANIAAGMAPHEARRQAVLQFGGVEAVKENCREQRRGFWLETLWADARYALRMLRKNPGFSAVAIVTLALGIGANTAIFSVLDAVVLKPLPYSQADRISLIWTDLKTAGQTRAPFSGPDLVDMSKRSRLLQDVGAIWVGNAALSGTGEPEQIKLGFVTANFLSILGVPPGQGRFFIAQDEVQGAAPAIILSDGLWRRRYGANPQTLGQSVKLNGQAVTVVGVMPASFRLIFPGDASVPPDVQAWSPFGEDLAGEPRDLNYLRVIARLRPGATIPQVQEELHSIAAQLRAEFLEDSKQGVDFQALSLQQDTTREIRPAVLALFAGVGLVLLIACVNVANLLLSRASLREREIALRAALGASRSRIVRQLLTESLLLSVLGGVAGLLLGWWGMHWLLALRPKTLVLLDSVSFNFAVLGYAFAVSLLAGILFGVAPAAESSRANLADTLKAATKNVVGRKNRSRAVLVTCEVALGFVLLIGSGLMIRTFFRLLNVDTGFRADHLLTFQLAPSYNRYPNDGDRARFFQQLRKNLLALPGVESVGGVSHLPLDDYPNWYSFYWREGAPPQDQNTLLADHRAITTGYFNALGVPVVAGREFEDSDDAAHRRVVVVDEALANRTWPNQSALGKQLNVEVISNGNFKRASADVVGVVKHVKYLQLTDDGRPQVYLPYGQSAREKLAISVRATGEPLALVGPIRAEVAKLDGDLPLSKVRLMNDYVRQARAGTRFTMLLAAALAVLALVLASIGIYGVTSYAVANRRNEIGIRMALGAQRRDILQLVLGQGMGSVIAGVLLGVVLSWLLTPMLASLLYGVRPTDLLTSVAVAVFLSAVGLLACYIPARRAMRVDPLVALRFE